MNYYGRRLAQGGGMKVGVRLHADGSIGGQRYVFACV